MPGTTERQYHPLATAPGERAGWNPGMTSNQVDPRLLRSAMPRRIKEAGGHTFSIFPAKLAACDLIQLSLGRRRRLAGSAMDDGPGWQWLWLTWIRGDLLQSRRRRGNTSSPIPNVLRIIAFSVR